MRGRKVIGLLLSVVTLIFVVACLLFFQANRDYQAQKGIEEAIKAYSATMEEQEIKVLTREINDVVERKLGEIGRDTLSDEDMDELLSMVVKEVEKATVKYRDGDITQEEVYRIATRIVQNTWEEKAESFTKEQLARLEAWQKQVESLLTRQNNMEAYLAQIQSDFKEQLAQNQSNAKNQMGNISKELSETAQNLTQNIQKGYEDLESSLREELKEHGTKTGEQMKEREDKIAEQMKEQGDKITEQMNEQENKIAQQLKEQAQKLEQMEGSILFYEYDADTQTLKLYGK